MHSPQGKSFVGVERNNHQNRFKPTDEIGKFQEDQNPDQFPKLSNNFIPYVNVSGVMLPVFAPRAKFVGDKISLFDLVGNGVARKELATKSAKCVRNIVDTTVEFVNDQVGDRWVLITLLDVIIMCEPGRLGKKYVENIFNKFQLCSDKYKHDSTISTMCEQINQSLLASGGSFVSLESSGSNEQYKQSPKSPEPQKDQ
jgi:hypothetical protein